MDTITHGIVGALIGKGFFSERNGRVATFAATAGAMFPDVDVVQEIFSSDPLAIVRYHRAITHSFVALPFFAALLAWLTRAGFAFAKKRWGLRDWDPPSWGILFIIYAIAIASHIFLDVDDFLRHAHLVSAIAANASAWDLLFIIDFSFTAIVLLPQIAAWIYSERSKMSARATAMWVLFSLCAFGAWKIAAAVGFPFHLWIVFLAVAIIAALFFLPAIRGGGFPRQRRALVPGRFCGDARLSFACSVAHHAALLRTRSFAATNNIPIDRIAALPLPPSLLDWGGVIRTTDGVYQSRFDLRDSAAPVFAFSADSPPNEFVARALLLPEVQLYWSFARFPGDSHFQRRWPPLRGFQRAPLHHAKSPRPRAVFLSCSI